ncbi:MAG: hypothetical protein EOP40_04790 [Rubrivivax sp.]|nr:MAG: hypothetical protein EOP40_04790 [Rubrivivax sp.]
MKSTIHFTSRRLVRAIAVAATGATLALASAPSMALKVSGMVDPGAEPQSVALALGGLGALAFLARRRLGS